MRKDEETKCCVTRVHAELVSELTCTRHQHSKAHHPARVAGSVVQHCPQHITFAPQPRNKVGGLCSLLPCGAHASASARPTACPSRPTRPRSIALTSWTILYEVTLCTLFLTLFQFPVVILVSPPPPRFPTLRRLRFRILTPHHLHLARPRLQPRAISIPSSPIMTPTPPPRPTHCAPPSFRTPSAYPRRRPAVLSPLTPPIFWVPHPRRQPHPLTHCRPTRKST